MIDTGKTKKVHGRNIPLYELDRFVKKIKPSGTSAHIVVSKKYIDQEAEVKILTLKPFICDRCVNFFNFEEDYSPNPSLCINCFSYSKSETTQTKLKGRKKKTIV